MVPVAAAPFSLGTLFWYWLALKHFRRLRDMNWIKRINPPPPRPRPRPRPKTARLVRMTRPARNIPNNALLWKEAEYNLRFIEIPDALVWIGFGFVCFFAAWHSVVQWSGNPHLALDREMNGFLLAMCCCGYLGAAGATFALQTLLVTSAVARERERGTLDFLLLLPVERSEILWIKWLAPWIRCRVLIVCTLAIPLVCTLFGVFPVRTGLVLLLLPWPTVLFVSALGLLLSVVCRRVVMANVLLVAILALLALGHLLLGNQMELMLKAFAELLMDDRHLRRLAPEEFSWAVRLLVTHQALFLLGAVGCLAMAFRLFARRA
jgi:hypothetical protein